LSSCDDEEFREMFRFRKREFMMIMHHLNLLMPDGSPTTLRVGRPGHKAVVPGDYCLMVCLARLSYPLRYVDLAKRLGGSRTICCDAFLYMVRSIDELFGHVVLDIDHWLESDNVMDCCDIMAAADHQAAADHRPSATTWQMDSIPPPRLLAFPSPAVAAVPRC
jgi:hypothetical protein